VLRLPPVHRSDTVHRSNTTLALFLAIAAALFLQSPTAVGAGENSQTEGEMKSYTQAIPNTAAKFKMMPIPAGTFVMGSPASEANRNRDEGPQVEVRIAPFWMGQCEVTWDEYEAFMTCLDIKRRQALGAASTPAEKAADAVARPTRPYTDMTFGMGKRQRPAICMTQLAARMYCRWLSAKTDHYYRLPTEAEWEYACRAGSTAAYHFGNDARQLGDYAWYQENSDDGYEKVGQKKPNAWGLHDMHGNVAEWVLDQYVADHYEQLAKNHAATGQALRKTLAIPTTLYPRVVRGGSWDETAEVLRSAARGKSEEDWKAQDPQIPQSIWYHTDALHVGFRVVRPLKRPSKDELATYWEMGTMMPVVSTPDEEPSAEEPLRNAGCNHE